MLRLTVDGVQLAYEERGSGEPLLLIHGTGFQTELWRSSLDDLSARHRVIAYDRRGYGRSQHRPVRDYRQHVTDAIEMIERVAQGPVVAVGHSSGASIALVVAAKRPDLVRALVVAEPPFHGLRYATRRELRQLMLGNARPVIAEADPHPTGVLFEHVPTRALIGIPAPITFLLAESSQPWFHHIHARLLRAMPHIQTVRIAGAGDYINSDVPAEFLAAVERGATRAARDPSPAAGGR